MYIKLPIAMTIGLLVCITLGIMGWYVYQARTAHRVLSEQSSYITQTQTSLFSLSTLWHEYASIISGRVSGRYTKEETESQIKTAQTRIDEEIKKLEKDINAIPQGVLIEQIKPQKTLQDMKNSIAVLKDADKKVFALPSPSATISAVRTYLKQLDAESATINTSLLQFSTASDLIILTAKQSLSPLSHWWIFLVPVIILSATAGYVLLSRYFSTSFDRLHASISHIVDIESKNGDPLPEGVHTTAELLDHLNMQITNHAHLVEKTITEKTQETEKIQSGLEKIISEQKHQYEEKIAELSTLNKSMIGRELKMAQLKQEIHTLKQKLGVRE